MSAAADHGLFAALDGERCTLQLFGRSPTSEEGNHLTLEETTDVHGNWFGPEDPTHRARVEATETALIKTLDVASGLSMSYLRALVREKSENTIVKVQCCAYIRNADSPVTPLTGPFDRARLGDFDPGAGVGVLQPATVCPYVKVRVSSSQWAGPIVMDCDRQMIVPAPHACAVAVTRPRDAVTGYPGWRDVGNMSRPHAELQGDVWDVFLWVKICHARNFPGPFPIVTEWYTPGDGVTYTFTRPRAARALFIGAQTAAQNWTMLSDRGVIIGTIAVPANQVLAVHTLPGFAALRTPAGPATYLVAWDVQP